MARTLSVAGVLNTLDRRGLLPAGTGDGRRGMYTWTVDPFRYALVGWLDRGTSSRLLWKLFVYPPGVFGESRESGGLGGGIALRTVDVPEEGLSVAGVGDFAARGSGFLVDLADHCRVSCAVEDDVRDGISTDLGPGLGARTVVALALARTLDNPELVAEIEAFLRSGVQVPAGNDLYPTHHDLLADARAWAKRLSHESGMPIPTP